MCVCVFKTMHIIKNRLFVIYSFRDSNRLLHGKDDVWAISYLVDRFAQARLPSNDPDTPEIHVVVELLSNHAYYFWGVYLYKG